MASSLYIFLSRLTVVLLTVKTFFFYVLHQFGRLVLALAEKLTMDSRSRQRRLAHCEVRKILWLRRPRMNTASGFATWSSHFEAPEKVLDENVVLYAAEEEFTYFVELPESAPKLLSSAQAPFAHAVICEKAVHILRLPTKVFRRVVDERLGQSLHHPVVIQNNQPRTGSTLLAQMVRRLSKEIMCISEPGYMQSLRWLQQTMPRPQYLQILSAAMRYNFRPFKGKSAFYMKQEGGICLAEDISEVLPKVKHVWLSRRDIVKMFASMKRMTVEQVSTAGPAQMVLLTAIWYWRFSPERVIRHWYSGQYKPASLYNNFRVLKVSMMETTAANILLRKVLAEYIDKTIGFKLKIDYEDMIKDPKPIMKVIGGLVELEGDVEAASGALHEDSQAGTIYDKKKMLERNYNVGRLLTDENLQRILKFGDAVGYPDLFQPLRHAEL